MARIENPFQIVFRHDPPFYRIAVDEHKHMELGFPIPVIQAIVLVVEYPGAWGTQEKACTRLANDIRRRFPFPDHLWAMDVSATRVRIIYDNASDKIKNYVRVPRSDVWMWQSAFETSFLEMEESERVE